MSIQDLLVGLRKGLLPLGALLIAAHLVPAARAASGIDGLWEATVAAGGVDIPFRFEIATTGTAAQGFFFEGDQKVGSTSGRFVDGVLTLEVFNQVDLQESLRVLHESLARVTGC